jgi:hypothetical protein
MCCGADTCMSGQVHCTAEANTTSQLLTPTRTKTHHHRLKRKTTHSPGIHETTCSGAPHSFVKLMPIFRRWFWGSLVDLIVFEQVRVGVIEIPTPLQLRVTRWRLDFVFEILNTVYGAVGNKEGSETRRQATRNGPTTNGQQHGQMFSRSSGL